MIRNEQPATPAQGFCWGVSLRYKERTSKSKRTLFLRKVKLKTCNTGAGDANTKTVKRQTPLLTRKES